MKPRVRESDIQRTIIARLNAIPGVFAWRINSGVANAGGRFVRFNSAPGCADIIACANGRFVAIECKSENGRVSKDQEQFGHAIARAGGWYLVSHTVEHAVEAVEILMRSNC